MMKLIAAMKLPGSHGSSIRELAWVTGAPGYQQYDDCPAGYTPGEGHVLAAARNLPALSGLRRRAFLLTFEKPNSCRPSLCS
jgi:hypothetical protein